MWKKLKKLIDEAEKFLKEYDATTAGGAGGDQSRLHDLLLYMNRWLLYFQHERLIHLIVTVLFALSMILVFGIFILSGDLYILLLLALILSLLVPYIVHYFHLENGVQTLYTLIDELEKRKEK
ncbi:MAG: hypothetical protein J6040_00925 [Clostridiales bacterium]|nr:hypothetical protein [Clostridiales bacterium]MBQ6270661.1 hypothetical protein [Clostridiales bacterium]MBR4010351.1 hypothetical protein [Clostridiales bacterium]MCR5058078.1 hypothetical protein [Clostridiales bacterium]